MVEFSGRSSAEHVTRAHSKMPTNEQFSSQTVSEFPTPVGRRRLLQLSVSLVPNGRVAAPVGDTTTPGLAGIWHVTGTHCGTLPQDPSSPHDALASRAQLPDIRLSAPATRKPGAQRYDTASPKMPSEAQPGGSSDWRRARRRRSGAGVVSGVVSVVASEAFPVEAFPGPPSAPSSAGGGGGRGAALATAGNAEHRTGLQATLRSESPHSVPLDTLQCTARDVGASLGHDPPSSPSAEHPSLSLPARKPSLHARRKSPPWRTASLGDHPSRFASSASQSAAGHARGTHRAAGVARQSAHVTA
mmetsp:Transcript_32995/g.78156  ORF Transcript_32995/g.78156 Transcript_32995/m.78156 type:complete len:302 (+) Transcript_32995:2021-2926(+)